MRVWIANSARSLALARSGNGTASPLTNYPKIDMFSRKTWSYRQLTQKLEDDIDYWINRAAETNGPYSIQMRRGYASGALIFWQSVVGVYSSDADYKRLEARIAEIGHRPTVVRKTA